MFTSCPKCGHRPLPEDQSFPATCAACGVILARAGQRAPARPARVEAKDDDDHSGLGQDPDRRSLASWLLHVPEEVEPVAFCVRLALLAAFAAWGVVLARMDITDGEMGGSFLHLPLLVFHEAGHVVFRPFGEWMMVFGGSFGQVLMPMVLCVALLWKARDPFGASIGLWLAGVSLMDVAPYIHDALHPQLMLLSGTTGDLGFHDWVWLLGDADALNRAPAIARRVHHAGVLVVVLSIAWGAWVLKRQSACLAARR